MWNFEHRRAPEVNSKRKINFMGIMEWKIKGSEAQQTIAKEITKPWYRKFEVWIGIVANIIALCALIIAIIALRK